MNNEDDQALSVEDSQFKHTALAELVNTEVKLTPILHKMLKYREDTQKMRLELAALCVPMLIKYKETLEMRQASLKTKFTELEKMDKEVEDFNYETRMNATLNN